jgi:enamine deaminase RidA (YjgF/YER057c/UK114 family)
MSVFDVVNPTALGRPRGFSHGLLAPAGARLLFVAGQTAADSAGRVTAPTFAQQFDGCLERVLAVVESAGGTPAHVGRMTVYVTSLDAYLASREMLGTIWKRRMNGHYPAMALVEVTRLVDEGAMVEIEATAAIPSP